MLWDTKVFLWLWLEREISQLAVCELPSTDLRRNTTLLQINLDDITKMMWTVWTTRSLLYVPRNEIWKLLFLSWYNIFLCLGLQWRKLFSQTCEFTGCGLERVEESCGWYGCRAGWWKVHQLLESSPKYIRRCVSLNPTSPIFSAFNAFGTPLLIVFDRIIKHLKSRDPLGPDF